jgi:hypothetical protein
VELSEIIKAWGLVPLQSERKSKMVVVSKQAQGGGTFTPHPEGQFGAVCVDVHDLGYLESTWQGQVKKQHKIDVYFFCDEWKQSGDEKYPLLVRERFTATLSDKGRLKPFLTSWRGKKFTPDEEAAFDLDKMIGAPALVTVEHNQVNDKTYANIVSITKLPKGMTAPTIPEDFVRFKDREPKEAQPEQPKPGPLDPDDADLPF